jgi:rare lipoprotein A
MVCITMSGRQCSIAFLAAALAAPALPSRASDIGYASFYGKSHEGKRTASGKVFAQGALTAAHRSLPFGTKLRVTNLRNGNSVIVEVADRGPFRRGRIVDVSYAAAEKLGFVSQGVARVSLEPF